MLTRRYHGEQRSQEALERIHVDQHESGKGHVFSGAVSPPSAAVGVSLKQAPRKVYRRNAAYIVADSVQEMKFPLILLILLILVLKACKLPVQYYTINII